jgi:prophage antirepressor-like protein
MSDINSELPLFNFQGHTIRIIIRHGEPWFVARDVCEALGLANHHQVIAVLSEHQKQGVHILDPYGRERITTIISEAALYKLAFRSNKEEAEAFTDWVASIVLPTLRKTGSYSLPQQEPGEPQQQPLQKAGLQAYLLSLSKDELDDELRYLCTIFVAVETFYNDKHPNLPLSKDALRCELHYLRALLTAVETIYNYKYPQVQTYEYPHEEQKPPRPVETVVLSPVETQSDLQAVLVDYLHKAETVTVRYLQQSGPRSLRNLPADQLRKMLQTLVENRVVKIVPLGKTEGYQLI